MADDLKIGLIGAGRHGRYLSPFMKEVGGVRLIAAADVDEEARTKAQAECGYERAYANYGAMLEKEDLDGLIVATPHNLLRDACLAAIAAGRHVFVEKPGAMSLREGQEIVAAARAAGVRLMVGYCVRYNGARTAMKELLAQGAAGQILAVAAGKGSRPFLGWLADPKLGGGQMLFLGSHIIDQVLWLVGRPVESVSTTEMTLDPETGCDDTTTFSLRFAGGIVAQFIVSRKAGVSFDYVEVVGTAGRLRAEWPSMLLSVHSSALPGFGQPATIRVLGDSHRPMYVAELAEFAAAIREGRDPAISGEDALPTLRVIDAVFESARTGKAIALAVPAKT